MDRRGVGKFGEQVAARFLRRRGYRILYQNWRCFLGEIDVVAKDRGFLVFVEIKTRTSGAFGSGCAAVGWAKQQKLIRLSRVFMKRYGLADVPCRIDIVSIDMDRDNRLLGCELIRDALWE